MTRDFLKSQNWLWLHSASLKQPEPELSRPVAAVWLSTSSSCKPPLVSDSKFCFHNSSNFYIIIGSNCLLLRANKDREAKKHFGAAGVPGSHAKPYCRKGSEKRTGLIWTCPFQTLWQNELPDGKFCRGPRQGCLNLLTGSKISHYSSIPLSINQTTIVS